MTLRELERIFLAERAAFARRYPRVRGAGLVVLRKPAHMPRRAMAFCETDRRHPLVGLYAPALELPRRNVVGLIRHELGHMASPRGSEQRADDIAAAVRGRKIRYDRRQIQTIGPGTYPRPRNIHK